MERVCETVFVKETIFPSSHSIRIASKAMKSAWLVELVLRFSNFKRDGRNSSVVYKSARKALLMQI